MKPRQQLAVCASLLGLGLAATPRVPAQALAIPEHHDAAAVPVAASPDSPPVANVLGLDVDDTPAPALEPAAVDNASVAARPAGNPASMAEIRRALGLEDLASAPTEAPQQAPEVDSRQAQRREDLASAVLLAVANAARPRRDLLPVPATYRVAEAAARQTTIAVPTVEERSPGGHPPAEDPKPQPEHRLVPALATGPSEPRRADVERGPEWLTVSENWLRAAEDSAASTRWPRAASDAVDAAFSESMSAGGWTGDAAASATGHAQRVMQALAEVRADELRWRGDLHAAVPDEPRALGDETLAHGERVLHDLARLRPSDGIGWRDAAQLQLQPEPQRQPQAPSVLEPQSLVLPQPQEPASHAVQDTEELGTSLEAARAFADRPLPTDGPWLPADTLADPQAPVVDRDPLRTQWSAVSDGQIDGVRGGFVVDRGLRISSASSAPSTSTAASSPPRV